jgi:predicted small secreted protein
MSRTRILASLLFAFASICVTVTLTGCNTVEGLGDDLKSASNATERAITGTPATKPAQ